MIFLWVSFSAVGNRLSVPQLSARVHESFDGLPQRARDANGGGPSVDDPPEAKIATLWPSPPNSDRAFCSLEG